MLKELINKILWHPDYDPKDYEIIYLHRVSDKEKIETEGMENNILRKIIEMNKISVEDSFVIYERDEI
jgi:uncharacterized protein (UPF0248 family)